MNKNSKILFIFLSFILIFIFRLIFGLYSQFCFPDELQIYLLGLKFYCNGGWPYFGPDVVYTASQIPGALQALLVGIPLKIIPLPESPFIFLNILSFVSLVILSLYILRLIPELPKSLVFLWILTCPWTLNFSTHIINPSYVLPAGIIFFIAFLETTKISTNWFNYKVAFFLMGFSFFWIFQLHMSWILLVVFIGLAFIFQLKDSFKKFLISILWFIIGSIPTLSLIIPTFIKYGFNLGSGGTLSNIRFSPLNLLNIFTILARFVSFGTFEITRFIGPSTPARINFLKEWWQVAIFVITGAIIGVVQALWMIIYIFKKLPDKKDNFFRILVSGTVVLIWISFFFSVKGPSSHTYYVVFPLAMIWYFITVKDLLKKKFWKIIFLVLIICGIFTHSAIGLKNYKTISLYKKRDLILLAIEKKDYKILGQRRKTKTGIGY